MAVKMVTPMKHTLPYATRPLGMLNAAAAAAVPFAPVEDRNMPLDDESQSPAEEEEDNSSAMLLTATRADELTPHSRQPAARGDAAEARTRDSREEYDT